MKTQSITGFIFWLAFICSAPSVGAQQEKAPVQEMRVGGYVILFRHGETDRQGFSGAWHPGGSNPCQWLLSNA